MKSHNPEGIRGENQPMITAALSGTEIGKITLTDTEKYLGIQETDMIQEIGTQEMLVDVSLEADMIQEIGTQEIGTQEMLEDISQEADMTQENVT